jgi:hypothetical protein
VATTPNGLPYPLGTDHVVDGDDAIRALADALDTLLLTPWTPYTPTYANFNPGASVVTARSKKVGKTVQSLGRIVMGAGFAMFGNPTITLPYPAAHAAGQAIGTVAIVDSGTTIFTGTMTISTATAMLPIAGISGLGLNTNVPMTWAVNDVLSWAIAYEAT